MSSVINAANVRKAEEADVINVAAMMMMMMMLILLCHSC